MSKTKTPFFSMGAQGSVGESITAQKLRGETLIRGKPCPTDPYSLPQAYQRWLYEDYAYLWTQQSTATKQEYASAGVRHHLTGFQYWMKYQLANLPDIAAWYKLDEKTGAIAHDSSRNANHGIITGPSPTDGLIDGAFYFDGLNDIVRVPDSPSLKPTTWTFEFFFRSSSAIPPQRGPFFKQITPIIQCMCLIDALGKMSIYHTIAAGLRALVSNLAVNDNVWRITHLINDGTDLRIYFDGVLDRTGVGSGGVSLTVTAPLIIGRWRLPQAEFYEDEIDNWIWYNRALDQTEITRHSLRRYPPQ